MLTMIGYLKGRVIEKRLAEVWLDVHDVGYRVKVGPRTYERLTSGELAELFVHTHAREDALELFGFLNRNELDLFELLLQVAGVAPKTALTVVGTQSVERIEQAIRQADVSFFQRVPGIGKKGAQRIIVDLKSKIGSVKEIDLSVEEKVDEDVVAALVQLGFSRGEIREVLKTIEPNISDEEKVREGLRRLGNRQK